MDAMRDLTLDEYAAWMLIHGYYDVNVHTGEVINLRRTSAVQPITHGTGYHVVNLVYNRAIVRQVKVHRLIAVKVWGVELIKGKQVGHIDGDKTYNSIINLWLPDTAAEHVKFDGTDRNLTRRAIPKQSWEPCAVCGDPNGRSTRGLTPDRLTGARFEVRGQICRRCYGRLQERERRQHRNA